MMIVAFFSVLSMTGQTKLTKEQEKDVLEKMDQSSNALRSLQCDFQQS